MLISTSLGIDPSSLKASKSSMTYTRFGIGILFSVMIIGTVYLIQRFYNKQPFSQLGFIKPALKHFVIGILIGIGIAAIVRIINISFAQSFTWKWSIPNQLEYNQLIFYYLVFLFIVILNSFQEELLFRAYPLELFKQNHHSLIYVILITSFIFAA